MSSDKTDGHESNEIVCGSCSLFGKLSLCPRRERYAEANTCGLYREKVLDKSELDELYKQLLIEYAEKGFTNPEVTLELTLKSYVEKGKTREQAILLIWEKESEGLPRRHEIKQNLEQQTEKIKRLALLFSRGEISEESYKNSVKAIEEERARLGKVTTTSTAIREPSPSSVPSDYESQWNERGGPSGLWWLVPFFFGIIGGLVGYVGVKDEDPDMASGLLLFGIIWSLVLTFIVYALFFSVIWH